jgi:N-acetylmuramoyl-L-alanine amidase
MAQRLVYAPKVLAYIKTSKEVLNISDDIISGNITRRTDAASSASIKLQNRNKFYNGRLKPMDRIIIYLQKTKPILVFSGYLDSVPYLQPIPGPITINASCTLKLLEYTYFDPGLPTVQALMARFVGAGEDFTALPDLGNNDFAFLDTRQNKDGTQIEEIGFGRMVLFLVNIVGRWPRDKVHILPIPDGWIETAIRLLAEIKTDEASTLAANVVKRLLTSQGTEDGGDGSTGGATETAALNASGEEVAAKIDSVIKSRRPNAPYNGYGRVFVREGVKQGIDPRFMAAITGAESSFGEDSGAQATHNGFGDLDSSSQLINFPTWEAGIVHLAKWLKENYINEGKTTVTSIRNKWAPAGAANDPNNLNDNWVPNVSKIMTEMGGDPKKSVVLATNSPMRERASSSRNSNVTSSSGSVGGATEEASSTSGPLGGALTFGSGSPNSSNTGKFSVVIEPGHADPKQPGFPQGGASGEASKNQLMTTKVKAILRNHPKISLKDTNGSNLSASNLGNPDIFVSLHHDQPGGGKFIDYPYDGSKNAQGQGMPNSYGAAASNPPPRKDLFNNDQLIKDSYGLASALESSTGLSKRHVSFASKNYYGYYYSNAKACALIEIDAANASYSYDTMAQKIAQGIINFVESGGPSGGGNATNDNSPAAKFIQLCVNEARANEASGYKKTPYDIDTGWRSGKLSDKPDGRGIDCSGFFKAVSLDLGMNDTAFGTTMTMDAKPEYKIGDVGNGDAANIEPGTFLVRGTSGAQAHMVLYIGDGKVVESSTVGSKSGPQINNYEDRTDSRGWRAYVVPVVGTTTSSGTWVDGALVDGGGEESPAFTASNALNAVFNFPGDPLESIVLQGARALENDVKLLEIVTQVTQASMRTFASHPNGDFMAWFPDYFNISQRTPYLIISENEIIDCTIELSDTNLATHVFVNGDIFGMNSLGTGSAPSLIQKITSGQYGMVNIEQAFLLDSFMSKTKERKDLLADLVGGPIGGAVAGTSSGTGPIGGAATAGARRRKKRLRTPLLDEGGAQAFLKRYGPRPFPITNPIIRHPYMNFFLAYQWFQRKWAEQFESNCEFTFMPELFPGTIIKLRSLNVNFYVNEVTHNFDYSSGFTTTATLMAPSTEDGYNFGMALSQPPFKISNDDDIEGISVEKLEASRQKALKTQNRARQQRNG